MTIIYLINHSSSKLFNEVYINSTRRSYYDESQVKIYIFFVAQILETLLFDNSVKPGQILLNLLIE